MTTSVTLRIGRGEADIRQQPAATLPLRRTNVP
jgi:hypothetical protein